MSTVSAHRHRSLLVVVVVLWARMHDAVSIYAQTSGYVGTNKQCLNCGKEVGELTSERGAVGVEAEESGEGVSPFPVD